MVNTSIGLGVALATLFNVAVVTATENPLSLDTTGWTANDTGFLGMPEEENNFYHGSSITERKKCPVTRQCTKAGGSCIKSKAFCDGKSDPKGCKGKTCKCCIPDQTTPAPSTCPTCPAPSTCPTTPAPLTCPTCPTCPAPSTCQACPTPAAITTPALTTTTTIPGSFERFNNRVIRRTISSDTKSSDWDVSMNFCNQFGAVPFIPRESIEYDLYKTVRLPLGNGGWMWLPANDRLQEGTLRWYNNTIATNIALWDWYSGRDLYHNDDTRDCLFYGYDGSAPKVHMLTCTGYSSYPPICEVL